MRDEKSDFQSLNNSRLRNVLSAIQLDFSVWTLIFVNFIPVLGGLFLGWDIRGILIVYWAENLVVGFYNVLKMSMAKSGIGSNQSKLFIIPFFTVHFGGFCAGHGLFIMIFLSSGIMGEGIGKDFDLNEGVFDWPGPLVFFGLFLNSIRFVWDNFGMSVLIPVLGLFISHGISFKQNYIDKKEYETTNLGLLMFQPYGRIVVMHVSIILAALPIFLIGSPMPLLILLIIFKTIVDVFFHSVSHQGGLRKLVFGNLPEMQEAMQKRDGSDWNP